MFDPALFPSIACFELRSPRGLQVGLIEHGATVVAILAPDRDGRLCDVVGGFDDLPAYVRHRNYMGATIGRTAGRIRHGRLPLGARVVQLPINQPPHHLHGGRMGFDRRRWSGTRIADNAVRFEIDSASGDQGYPGALQALVTWRLEGEGRLVMEWEATAVAEGVVDLTHHGYFNLAGHDAGAVGSHHLQIFGDAVLALDSDGAPSSEWLSVAGTPFDFRNMRPISDALATDHPQLAMAGGIDHCWHIPGPNELRHAAVLTDPGSGRRLDVWSDRPALQVYTANHLENGPRGKGGVRYRRQSLIALETQFPPDAINRPGEPAPLIGAGETRRGTTVYAFSVE